MIHIDGLRFDYDGTRVIDDLTATLGRRTCVTGPSGVGKTTLLRLLAGLEKPSAGTITGVPARVAVLFQEDRLLSWCSARQNVAAVLPPTRGGEADEWLRQVELGEQMDSLPDKLSGGQKRRVALARALAFGGGLLILDEPFKGLDPALTERMAALITAQDTAIVASVHAADEIMLLGGEIIKLA